MNRCIHHQTALELIIPELQGDQIRRKFATCAKIFKDVGKFLRGTLYFITFWTFFGHLCYLANFHCCKWPKIEENNLAIWSHWIPTLSRSLQILLSISCTYLLIALLIMASKWIRHDELGPSIFHRASLYSIYFKQSIIVLTQIVESSLSRKENFPITNII